MPSPILVNATELVSWAARRDAQSSLPRVLRRLVRATVDQVIRLEFRADEGVQLGGWDGIVEVPGGNEYVPDGLSAWEIGTDAKVKTKADEDYEKRSDDPLGLDPAETMYVFVTPRRWRDKKKWAESRTKEGVWREVRAYDADDLEAWLERAPGVHIWLSSLLGKHPEGVSDLSNFWSDWSEATKPPVSADLVISGREATVQQIHEWLGGQPSALALQADSPEEALAFFVAALEKLPDEQQLGYLARGVIVHDRVAWQRLATSANSLLLVPVFEDRGLVARASQHGHYVLAPLGRSDSTSTGAVEIPRPSRDSAEAALVAMGFPQDRARDLGTLARRSLMSLRRKLAVLPEVQRPNWAAASEAAPLLPAMLAGTWNDTAEGDREALARLAGTPYDQVSRILTRWANESDPPVRRVGDTWLLASKEDAWALFARFLTREDLDRFRDVVLEVLGTPDPRLDLPADQRFIANLLGKSPRHSGLLEMGLADTLALMGSRSETTRLGNASSAQDRATRIVGELLECANGDWRIWASLSGVLQSLAEAAPNAFLDAVDAGLSGEQPVLLNVFSESESSLSGSSPHTGLLWALEVLAWSPEHLSRAALLLAKLTRLDPGGKLLNRPISSLRDIFLFWRPHTDASFDQRLRVLDMICAKEPGVAWRLLCKLLPEGHSSVSPTAKPKWREWGPESQPMVTWAEIWKAASEVTMRLVEEVDFDGARWAELINHLGDLPLDAHNAIIDRLLSMRVSAFAPADRMAVWSALRQVISRHRSFPDAKWAMPAEFVDQLERAYKRFEPRDPVAKYSWLFSDLPAMVRTRAENWEAHHKALERARVRAVLAVHKKGGVPLLLEMVAQVKRPYDVGLALGRSELLKDEENELLSQELASVNPARAEFARGFVIGREISRGLEWVESKLVNVGEQGWSPDQQAEFLTCLPFTGQIWEQVESLGAEVERSYWQRTRAFGIRNAGDAARAARMYLKHRRPYSAIDLLAMYTRDEGSEMPPALIADALEQAMQTDPETDPHMQSFGYHAGQLLNALEASGEIDEQRIAQLEWVYLPVTKHWHQRTPRILHRALARDPKFFAEVTAFVYPAESEGDHESSEADAMHTQLGYELLESWRSIPGVREDGTVDGEALRDWVARARIEISERRRRGGDALIGQTLRYSPADENGIWPAVPVRDLIEELASDELEHAIEIEFYNSRGVTTRMPTDGGRQERFLAERYLGGASAVQDPWPRTAAMLRRLADTYSRDARREDVDAELTEDLWR